MKSAWIALLLVGAFTVNWSWALGSDTDSSLHSQKRDPGESYVDALRRYTDQVSQIKPPVRGARTAIDAAVHYEFLNFSRLTRWDGGIQSVYSGFNLSRDERFLYTKSHIGFARRIPWLYPDDGCYARSAVQGMELEKLGFVRPSKIFIFGDLELRTPNNADRKVTWWYHEANAVTDGTNIWILDPAVEPKKPIQLIEWLTSITRKPDSTFLAICSPYTYSPADVCFTATPDLEDSAPKDVLEYLDEEWIRIHDLKRVPESELGDNPPWKN